ncbi:MAG: tRNA-dihydrouridine synthase family protein [Bacteroidetes bacterium]|nr:tRNA-dihydrouridine synthase family protein [Bacteroidota bacterium]MCL1968905.1 tRNA-dihydrouridine synthase family protein [Bacteroidota bacterium]MCL1969020.1 tRNA-dihydrouridine synthase family protein [Bacteroidota bacterium]
MKLWLAPLHGITGYLFRNCFIKHFQGIDYAITPFIAAQPKDKLNPKKLRDLFPENNTGLHIIPQFMGNKPVDIKETVVVLYETFGYSQFNWNIGCPVNNIVRKKRGCGVMPFPDLIEDTVNEVCSKTSVHFSLKMRLGFHSPEEGLEILQRLAPYPIDFLCIHPRLGVQQYEGTVNLDMFETFYQTTQHTIVYSGDINDTDFFIRLHQRFPKIENWMLGRGILQNPFLAEEIIHIAESRNQKAESTKKTSFIQINLRSRFIDFYNEYAELLCVLKGEKVALSVLKELWHYFAVFWKLDSLELKRLLQINDYSEFQKTIEKKIFNKM